MLLTKTYSVLLLLLFSITALSQTGTISGTVTFDNNEIALGAYIALKSDSFKKETSTGVEGEFSLKAIPFGKYTLEIYSLNAKPKSIDVVLNSNKKTINTILTLTDFQDLNEVLVKTKTAKKKIEEGGFAVAIIETKEASLRNLSTNELLDRSVGVRIRQNGGIGSDVEYNLNGMSGSTIGIFLDGLEISTYGQSFNLNNIPTSMIERIEVYKGVLPAHLTGDYSGGAINVVLKKDVSQNNITLATSYGSFNTSQSDIGVTLRDKKTGLSFRGSAFNTYTDNSYETWGNSTTYVDENGVISRSYRAKRFNNTYKSLGGRFEVGFTDTKWADQFFIGYNGSSAHKEIPHGTTMAVPYVGRFNDTKAHVLLLNYSKNNFLTENLALKVNAARSYRSTYLQDTVGVAYNWDGKERLRPEKVADLDENGNEQYEIDENGRETLKTKTIYLILNTLNGGQQGEKVITNVDRKITTMRSNLGYMIADSHRVSLNHKYESTYREDQDLLKENYGELATRSTIAQNIISVNYEAETFNKKLKTNFLGKFTHNRNNLTEYDISTTNGVNSIVKKDTLSTNSNFGYGGTLSYNPVDNLYIIASTENSYKSPTETQLYGAAEINILPNTQLIPEKNINYNLGFRLGSLKFNKHKLSVYGNAFWRNGFDKITKQAVDVNDFDDIKEEDADIQVTRYVNLGKTQARGFEAEIMYIYDNKLNTSLNFSKFNNVFKQEDENGEEHSLYGQQVPNEPFFTINLNAQYRFNDVFQEKSVLNAYYNMSFVGEYYIVWGQPEWSKTPSQLSHDIGLSYRFPSQKLIASLDVKNIFNAELYDNFAIQKPGRGIYFKLNYTISKFL